MQLVEIQVMDMAPLMISQWSNENNINWKSSSDKEKKAHKSLGEHLLKDGKLGNMRDMK
jgi:hypothetical protein